MGKVICLSQRAEFATVARECPREWISARSSFPFSGIGFETLDEIAVVWIKRVSGRCTIGTF